MIPFRYPKYPGNTSKQNEYRVEHYIQHVFLHVTRNNVIDTKLRPFIDVTMNGNSSKNDEVLTFTVKHWSDSTKTATWAPKKEPRLLAAYYEYDPTATQAVGFNFGIKKDGTIPSITVKPSTSQGGYSGYNYYFLVLVYCDDYGIYTYRHRFTTYWTGKTRPSTSSGSYSSGSGYGGGGWSSSSSSSSSRSSSQEWQRGSPGSTAPNQATMDSTQWGYWWKDNGDGTITQMKAPYKGASSNWDTRVVPKPGYSGSSGSGGGYSGGGYSGGGSSSSGSRGSSGGGYVSSSGTWHASYTDFKYSKDWLNGAN